MIWLLLGCAERELVTQTGDEADSDTDADSDSDSDTDADTDTTGETGLQTDCLGVPSELETFIEARDATGPCTLCQMPVTLAVGVRNPCGIPVSFPGMADCLVPNYRVTSSRGSVSGGLDCPVGATLQDIEVPALGVEERTFALGNDVGPGGEWHATAELSSDPPQDLETDFEMQ
jgi:hypothetical protein